MNTLRAALASLEPVESIVEGTEITTGTDGGSVFGWGVGLGAGRDVGTEGVLTAGAGRAGVGVDVGVGVGVGVAVGVGPDPKA
jgi:hypothetical protein